MPIKILRSIFNTRQTICSIYNIYQQFPLFAVFALSSRFVYFIRKIGCQSPPRFLLVILYSAHSLARFITLSSPNFPSFLEILYTQRNMTNVHLTRTVR